MKKTLVNAGVLLATLLALFAIDRWLLYRYPLPQWQADSVLHYKHRPGTYRWGKRYDHKPIVINEHGFHDDDFPINKPAGELRGLILGDSIVMGHGVTAAEAFPNRIEHLLPDALPGHASYQVINAGVQGYSTFQYLEVMKRTLRFAPDFVVVGFCMNDVTEPYRVNTNYGGSGLDYHRIAQSQSDLLGYLLNETGFGRFAIRTRLRMRSNWASHRDLVRAEIYDVRRMAEEMTSDPVYEASWNSALADLDAIYALAKAHRLPLILVVFPHTFQLGEAALQAPQRRLLAHAEERGIPALDMAKVAESQMDGGARVRDLFLDADHYTPNGHRVVAASVMEYIVRFGESLRAQTSG
ncbi:MAG: SGNH/GDSL hydrolase family protein [Pseudomonadota bacterium]